MTELFFAFLCTRREYRSASSCSRVLVGPIREYLQQHGDRAMLRDVPNPPPRLMELLDKREAASKAAADFCARCGRCSWAQKPA